LAKKETEENIRAIKNEKKTIINIDEASTLIEDKKLEETVNSGLLIIFSWLVLDIMSEISEIVDI
jgi:hypothetical protein